MNLINNIEKYINLIEDRDKKDMYTIEEQDPIYELEEEILRFFGLPTSFSISECLQEAVLNENGAPLNAEELKHFIQKLSTDYLQSKPFTDKEILQIGKKNKTAFDDVLPLMGIIPNGYCVFIYETLFCRDKINIDEAIAALYKYSKDESSYINTLVSIIDDYELKVDFVAYSKLKDEGYPYLDEFIQLEISLVCRTKADTKAWSSLFKKKTRLGETLELSCYFITRIEYSNPDDPIFLNTIFKTSNHEWFGIVIVCNDQNFEAILSNSKFAYHSSLIRCNINSGVSILDLQTDFIMRQLEITGLHLNLFSSNTNEEQNDLEGYYSINSCYVIDLDNKDIAVNNITKNAGLPF